jgi:hypothetical protein
MVPLGYSPRPPSAPATDVDGSGSRLDSTQDASPLIRNVLRRKEQVLIPEIDRLIDLRQKQAVACTYVCCVRVHRCGMLVGCLA